MIYFCISALPDGFSIEHAALSLKSSFCGKENSEYIDKIANRAPSAAAEGLYALEILAEMLNKCFPEVLHDNVTLARQERGKPYFKGSNLKFSISHSCGMVACAISDNGEVGIDVEVADITPSRAEGIAARFFSAADIKRTSGDVEAFKREWTRKEAAAKMHGMPLAEYLKLSKSGELKDIPVPCYFEYTEHNFPVTICTDNHQNTVKRVIVNANS